MSTLQERLVRHLEELSSHTEGSLLAATHAEILDFAIDSEPDLESAALGRASGSVPGTLEATPGFGLDGPDDADPVKSAVDGVEAMRSGIVPSPEETFFAAAIILKKDRPTYAVTDDWLAMPPEPPFADLAHHENTLRQRIHAVGRIQAAGVPYADNVAGTGFIVAHDLLMTNRHVASYFVDGLGQRQAADPPGLVFKPASDPRGDLKAELGNPDSLPLGFVEPVLMHPYWDIAILRVSGDALAGIEPLKLLAQRPDHLLGEPVVLIGYPVEQFLQDLELRELRKVLFGPNFGIKRLMPGTLVDRDETTTQNPLATDGSRRTVPAIGHDATTLAGNSGSAVIEPEAGCVIGVHFRGLPLDANFAVPAWELARDPRLHALGVHFTGGPVEAPDPEVEAVWQLAATA